MLAVRPETVVVVPVPDIVVPSGFLVNVHLPDEGRLVNITLPDSRVQVGWVIVPTDGTEGVEGCALITALADDADVQPDEFVTVKVYILAGSPEIVTVVPVPEYVSPPGVLVMVHVPAGGNPLSTTLPVSTAHVG